MTLSFRVKTLLKNIPLIGPFLIRHRRRQEKFKNSTEYWDRRYRKGGNSGAGSYNRLAEFKANFLNRFVDEHRIASVIEYGCGDGAQLKLAQYPNYIGVDISPKAVEMCRILFSGDTSKQFLQLDAGIPYPACDLSLSLDVVYHLVEDAMFDAYMRRLFESARRFVIVYSSNIDQEWTGKHVRHRHFTRWIEQNKPEWFLRFTLKNAYPYDSTDPDQTSFADFYVFGRR